MAPATPAPTVPTVEPGWHYAQGDPANTVRYWDGTGWQGEAKSKNATNDVIHFVAPDESHLDLSSVVAAAPRVRTTTNNYNVSPYSVSAGRVNVKRRRPIPKLLIKLVTLVTVLKALPLIQFVFSLATGVRDRALYDTPILRSLTNGLEENVPAVALLFAWALLGPVLLASQFGAMMKERIQSVLAAALLLTLVDLVFAFTLFARPITLAIVVAQAAIAVWAWIASQRDA